MTTKFDNPASALQAKNPRREGNQIAEQWKTKTYDRRIRGQDKQDENALVKSEEKHHTIVRGLKEEIQ